MQKYTGKQMILLSTDDDLSKWKKRGVIAAGIFFVYLIIAAIANNNQTVAEKQNIAQKTSTTQAAISTQADDKNIDESEEKEDEKSVEKSKAINGETYKIVSVIDGDTVKINYNGSLVSVRLIGIDTPETVHPSKPVECYGPEASSQLKNMLTGKTVILEADASQGNTDYYGRLLRYVWLDGVNINKYMISYGYAREYTYGAPYKYQDEFRKAESSAKLMNMGLWKICDAI